MSPSGEDCGEQQVSALQDNIAKNGAQSYYYAHKARNTGEAPAPPPIHIVLEKATLETADLPETIFSYQFLDDGKVVKVYIPLEGVGAAIEDSSISCTFQTRSLELCIRDFKPRVMKLAVKELAGDILPDECTTKKLANKVVVTLKKADAAATWSKLSGK